MISVGDKVKNIGYGSYGHLNDIGTVINIDGSRVPYLVRFDDGKTIWFKGNQLELVPMLQKIIITHDNNQITAAYNHNDIEESVSVDADKYASFEHGAQSALMRVTHLATPKKPKQDKPKQEPIKLYCVKSYNPGVWLTEGKIYNATSDFRVTYDNGYIGLPHNSAEQLRKDNPYVGAPLYQLVSRKAKVGESVYVKEGHGCLNGKGYKAGDVLQIVAPYNKRDEVYYETKSGCYLCDNEYLVLDGYKPEKCPCCGQ